MTPYYNKPPQRGIVAHFEAIARASDLPIVVYNIPSRVVINIEPETITRLAEIETVRAVKQANDDLAQARHIVDTGLDLYAGDDNLIQPFLELGGIGGICVHTHVVGPQVAEQVRATLDGDVDRGRELDRELGPRTSCSRWRRTRSRSRRRSTCSATRSAAIACRSCRRRSEEIAGVRACLERLGLLVAATSTSGPRATYTHDAYGRCVARDPARRARRGRART